MRALPWLDGAIRDDVTGAYSSSRLNAVLATAALSLALLILCAATIVADKDLSMAIGAVAVPLAGLGGYNYGKKITAGEAKGE